MNIENKMATTILIGTILIFAIVNNAGAYYGANNSCKSSTIVPNDQRQINWSGYTWNVVNDSWSGNNFSDSTDNVFVDGQGNLHLKITNRNGTWYSAEVVMTTPVGYGTYTTVVASNISILDRNVDAGSFYYNNANADEIDIEFSRWGTDYLPPNVEYTVWQTGINATESDHFSLNATSNTTHIINYQPNGISGESKDGNDTTITSWIYPGTYIPKIGGNYELELWLYPDGNPPSNGLEQELVISNFTIQK